VNKKTTILAGLLIFLLGFQVSEFLRAPNNAVTTLKGKLAFVAMERDLRFVYGNKGLSGVDEQCGEPLEKWGYHFTCHTSVGFESMSGGGDFIVWDVALFRWNDPTEAKEIAMFRQAYHNSRGDHPNLYRVGVDGASSSY
jgi:hypothetical protein